MGGWNVPQGSPLSLSLLSSWAMLPKNFSSWEVLFVLFCVWVHFIGFLLSLKLGKRCCICMCFGVLKVVLFWVGVSDDDVV